MAINPPKSRPLTPKQRRFVEALPTSSSLTDAVLIAGYDTPRDNAHVVAYDNLRKPAIRDAVAAQQQAATSEKVMTLLKRKERLSELAIPDPKTPDPLGAIAELNRMERVYGEPAPTGDTYNTQILVRYSLEELDAMLEAVKARNATKP